MHVAGEYDISASLEPPQQSYPIILKNNRSTSIEAYLECNGLFQSKLWYIVQPGNQECWERYMGALTMTIKLPNASRHVCVSTLPTDIVEVYEHECILRNETNTKVEIKFYDL